MRPIIRSLVLAATCAVFLSSTPAKAEVFFLEDQNDGYSVTFPDLWGLVENQKPDDKLTVAAPGTNALATCRVRVRDDHRFLIYPPNKFAADIQKVGFSRDFWNTYLGEYNDVTVDFFKDEAGLGRGHASVVEATYTTAEGTIARKRGIMFAALYRDNVYILDCASEETVYDQFRPDFLGIIKSVDFRKEVHERVNGNYRDFLHDEELIINGPEKQRSYKF